MTQPTTTLPPVTDTTDWPEPRWGSPAGAPPPAPPAKRKIGRYIAGGVALLFIIGMLAGGDDKTDTSSSDGVVTTPTTASTPAATTKPTTATPATSLSMATWTSRYGSDDAATLGSDLTALSEDADAMDISGMSSSCRTFQRHLTTAKSHLPTPDAQLTSALTTAYGYFSQATAACISGIANMDPDELGEMATYIQLGGASINTATARIKALS